MNKKIDMRSSVKTQMKDTFGAKYQEEQLKKNKRINEKKKATTHKNYKCIWIV